MTTGVSGNSSPQEVEKISPPPTTEVMHIPQSTSPNLKLLFMYPKVKQTEVLHSNKSKRSLILSRNRQSLPHSLQKGPTLNKSTNYASSQDIYGCSGDAPQASTGSNSLQRLMISGGMRPITAQSRNKNTFGRVTTVEKSSYCHDGDQRFPASRNSNRFLMTPSMLQNSYINEHLVHSSNKAA